MTYRAKSPWCRASSRNLVFRPLSNRSSVLEINATENMDRKKVRSEVSVELASDAEPVRALVDAVQPHVMCTNAHLHLLLGLGRESLWDDLDGSSMSTRQMPGSASRRTTTGMLLRYEAMTCLPPWPSGITASPRRTSWLWRCILAAVNGCCFVFR